MAASWPPWPRPSRGPGRAAQSRAGQGRTSARPTPQVVLRFRNPSRRESLAGRLQSKNVEKLPSSSWIRRPLALVWYASRQRPAEVVAPECATTPASHYRCWEEVTRRHCLPGSGTSLASRSSFARSVLSGTLGPASPWRWPQRDAGRRHKAFRKDRIARCTAVHYPGTRPATRASRPVVAQEQVARARGRRLPACGRRTFLVAAVASHGVHIPFALDNVRPASFGARRGNYSNKTRTKSHEACTTLVFPPQAASFSPSAPGAAGLDCSPVAPSRGMVWHDGDTCARGESSTSLGPSEGFSPPPPSPIPPSSDSSSAIFFVSSEERTKRAERERERAPAGRPVSRPPGSRTKHGCPARLRPRPRGPSWPTASPCGVRFFSAGALVLDARRRGRRAPPGDRPSRRGRRRRARAGPALDGPFRGGARAGDDRGPPAPTCVRARPPACCAPPRKRLATAEGRAALGSSCSTAGPRRRSVLPRIGPVRPVGLSPPPSCSTAPGEEYPSSPCPAGDVRLLTR
jgi:hypothetical protein